MIEFSLKRNAFTELDKAFNILYSAAQNTAPSKGYYKNQAKVNISQTPDMQTIQVLAYGYDKKDISISINDNTMSIVGVKKATKTLKAKYDIQQFGEVSVDMTIPLPKNANFKNIVATCQNGILTIEVPLLVKKDISIAVS